MSAEHPDRDQLLRFLDDGMPEAESRELQRHLFVCSECEERLIALLPGWNGAAGALPREPVAEEGGTPEEAYRTLLKRALADSRSAAERKSTRLCREKAEAGLLLREIHALPAGSRVPVVRQDARFHRWGLFEHLLEQARQEVLEDPRGAEADFRVAAELAQHLDSRRYGPGSVEAAQARAWAYLGNAQRILFDFHGAEECFEIAEEYFERSWLDPLDEALVLELKALLKRAERRFDEALPLFDQAIALYREVNETHFEGRARIAKGLALQYAGEVAAAVACLKEGLALIDPEEEPRLLFAGHGNLLLCLAESGRHAEAAAFLPEVRALCERVGTPTDLVRLRWTEGRVARGLGRWEQAEAAFSEVRAAFLASDSAYDAALVSLDLAAVYVRAGRTAETRRLASELLPIFRSREIHREALAALLFFQRAAQIEQVTASLVERVSSYLESARSNPELRFRPASGEDDHPAGETGPAALAS